MSFSNLLYVYAMFYKWNSLGTEGLPQRTGTAIHTWWKYKNRKKPNTDTKKKHYLFYY